MASFFNQQINLTYPALIKTNDNTAINATPKALSDGDGNLLPVSVGTVSMLYTGTQDFTGATVLGVGGGAAGLVAGTGTDSMKSADTLTVTAASAAGLRSIALGSGAVAADDDNISIGSAVSAASTAVKRITIGTNNNNFAEKSIQIGSDITNADASRVQSIVIGNNVKAAQRAIVIGNDCTNFVSADCVQIGNNHLTMNANKGVSIGFGNSLLNFVDDTIVLGTSNVNGLVGAAIVGNDLTAVAASTLHCNSLNINVVDQHADNAAAIAAGLPVGQVYRTGDLLKVRH